MVFSLTDFNTISLPSDTRKTPLIHPPDSPEIQPDLLLNTEATNEPSSQQNTPLPIPALDPALLALSSPTSNHPKNPILHGEDLTQLARHLALQKSLPKQSADELVSFAKRSLGEQLIWIAATQLSLNESVLAVFCGEVSPTLLKHIRQEVSKRILLSNLPAYKNDQVGFVKTEIAQSLGNDPATKLGTDGLPTRRPSSLSISELTMDILQAVPTTKGIRFSVLLATRVAFLQYCYVLSQSSKCDYWGLVNKKLEEIRKTVKDSNAISQKFTKILHVDQCTYGTADDAHRPLIDNASSTRCVSGSGSIIGGKRKRS